MNKTFFLVLALVAVSNAATVSDILLARQLALSEKDKPGLCAELAAALDDFKDTINCKYEVGEDFNGRETQWVSCGEIRLNVAKEGSMYAKMTAENHRIDVRVEGSTCIYAVAGDLSLAVVSQLTKTQKNNIRKETAKIIELHQSKTKLK